MTQQYLAGEVSARLEQLLAVTSADRAVQVTRLRRQVESCPLSWLAAAVARALVLADRMCWDSLSCGDTALFARQACVSADLRQFGICSRLLADDMPDGSTKDGRGSNQP